MKKTIGFILTLVFVVLLSSVVTVHAETYLIGIKDYAEQNVKKKSKNVKKNKKSKKSKKVKKVKKKDIGTIKVVSASSLYTKSIDDLSKIDYQKAVTSVLRPTNGNIVRLPFFDKFVTQDNSGILVLNRDDSLEGFVTYDFDSYTFGFIDCDNLACVEIYGYFRDEVDIVIKKFLEAGVELSFSKELLNNILFNDKSYRFKIGDASWNLKKISTGLRLERIVKHVELKHRDAFKAAVYRRVDITPSFYDHLLTFLNTTDILNEDKGGLLNVDLEDGNFEYALFGGDTMIERLIFKDLQKYGRTELTIGGYLNHETAVEDLTRILKNYCGVDFNEFDTSRVNKIVENDLVNWDPVEYVKYYGENKLDIYVRYAREKGYAFSIKVTVFNKK